MNGVSDEKVEFEDINIPANTWTNVKTKFENIKSMKKRLRNFFIYVLLLTILFALFLSLTSEENKLASGNLVDLGIFILQSVGLIILTFLPMSIIVTILFVLLNRVFSFYKFANAGPYWIDDEENLFYYLYLILEMLEEINVEKCDPDLIENIRGIIDNAINSCELVENKIDVSYTDKNAEKLYKLKNFLIKLKYNVHKKCYTDEIVRFLKHLLVNLENNELNFNENLFPKFEGGISPKKEIGIIGRIKEIFNKLPEKATSSFLNLIFYTILIGLLFALIASVISYAFLNFAIIKEGDLITVILGLIGAFLTTALFLVAFVTYRKNK